MAKILVVDDRISNREFLETLLGYYHHQVIIAEDGAKALAMARSERPDLIITDILMPVMDGYELALQLREDPELKHIPIIFYSATFRLEDAALIALKSGVKHILSKPSEPQKIIDMVNDALQGSEAKATGKSKQTVATSDVTATANYDFTPELEAIKSVKNSLLAHTQEIINAREKLIAMTHRLPQNLNPLTNIRSRLSTLIELHLDLELEHDPIRLLSLFGAGAVKILGAQSGVLGILNQDHTEFDHYLIFRKDSVSIENTNQPDSSQGIIKDILSKQEPLLINNFTETTKRLLSHPPIHKTFIGSRISTAHKLLGIIYFGDKEDNTLFNVVDVALTNALATQFAELYDDKLKSFINKKNFAGELG